MPNHDVSTQLLFDQLEIAKYLMSNPEAMDWHEKAVELCRLIVTLNLYVISGGPIPDPWQNKQALREYLSSH